MAALLHGAARRVSPPRVPSQAPRIPWSVAGPDSVSGFSATCWFHGKGLADALGPSVPIGLLESAWGSTEIQVCAMETVCVKRTHVRPATPPLPDAGLGAPRDQ